ncbi:MAG: UDP-N-acetylmuramoyl-L-alanine--D-glutamate ligase [Anaerolineales bacterium]
MNDDPLSLDGKHVMVLGIGRQGKALARWLPTQGARVTLSDSKDFGELADEMLELTTLGDNVALDLGGHTIALLEETDMVCISGGVPPTIPFIEEARQRDIPVRNDALLFLERCPALVVGITGSAGKTTTTSLLGEMCRADGRKTWVGGNIGHVLLDDLADIGPEDVVVMELSSFQLEIADISPDIAAVLNITPNHLDRHGSFQNYAAAKANIFLHQRGDDTVILSDDNLAAKQLEDLAPAQVARFSAQHMVTDGAFLLGKRLAVAGICSPTHEAKVVCEVGDIRLRGAHNIQNVLAACALAGRVGVSTEAMREAIIHFSGVEHRLEIVAEINGVQWVNDSIATAPERVSAALRSFEEPLVLLAGGKDKDLPWNDMAALAVERCRVVITFGDHRMAIADAIKRAQRGVIGGRLQRIVVVNTLDEAVHRAAKVAQSGDVVLLSPGGTSYDAYRDFAERGDHFRDLVQRLQDKS